MWLLSVQISQWHFSAGKTRKKSLINKSNVVNGNAEIPDAKCNPTNIDKKTAALFRLIIIVKIILYAVIGPFHRSETVRVL